MDSSRRPSGIQQLLAAEQEAQQIVNAARAGKFLIFGLINYVSSIILCSENIMKSVRVCSVCYNGYFIF